MTSIVSNRESTLIQRIFFIFRHSSSYFNINHTHILECFGFANLNERLVLIKSQMVVDAYRAQQESMKRRAKERKIDAISKKLFEAHSVHHLSGKANDFFEKGLFEKYVRNYEEDIHEKCEMRADSESGGRRGKTSRLMEKNASQMNRFSVFGSRMDHSLFQNTFNLFKKFGGVSGNEKRESQLRPGDNDYDVKYMPTDVRVERAFGSFFKKPNMFLLLRNNSFTLMPALPKKSVFYLEFYHKYR